MTIKRKISRREFIHLSTVTAAGFAIAACAGDGATVEEAGEQAAAQEDNSQAEAQAAADMSATQYQEAPMLADLVAAGELPSVDERLPADPLVVPVIDNIGQYGGTIRRGFKGVSDRWGPTKVQDSSLIRYDLDLNKHPDLLESWEYNDDATEITLHLRQGLKWSDGTEFDSSAFTWWHEHVASNETLTPAPHVRFSTGDPRVLMEMEAVDNHTIKLTFAHPKPLFIDFMSRLQPFTPGHYMSQFHVDTTEDADALGAAAEEAGFEAWDKYYSDRNQWYLNPKKPSVGPWRAANQLSEELFLMERNPYFHQIDADGQQLPYIDTITHRIFETTEVFDLWIINGEIDWQNRHVNVGNFTVYKESEDSGDYQVLVGIGSGGETLSINHASKNERLNKFFGIREVRQALNLAIDREAINELILDGLGTPRQASPSSASPQYHEAATTAFATHDPDQANALLDDAGFREKDSEGFRLWNDDSGETLGFIIEGTAALGSSSEDTILLVIEQLADVGVKASYQGMERSLYEARWTANEIEAAWWGAGHDILPFLSHSNYFIGELLDRPWAGAWGRWYRNNNDPNGEQPPEGHFLWDSWEIWGQAIEEPDEGKRNEFFAQIMDIFAEEVPVVGIVGELPRLIIVKNGLQNMMSGYVLQDATRDESLINPAQLYWDDPASHS
ncbi:ABC transporter substrate-binding protein [Chloroflexi bacterium TSY]|nr:ABC transporter substrate-binding protein [Chloroflexi bacterium TSY]